MKTLQLTLRTAITPAVWGTTYIVTSELLPDGYPLFAGLMRALPAGLVAVALAKTLPRGSWWWRSTVLGILNIGAFFPLLFITAYLLPGGVAATLGAAQPVIVALLAVLILQETLSPWRWIWGIAGIIGVALVVLQSNATLSVAGVAAGLLGAVSMAFGVTLTKKWGRPNGVTAMGFAGWQLTSGGLVLLPVTLIIEGVPSNITGAAAAGYAWLGLFGGIVAYTLWFDGLARLPVTSVAVLGLISPLVAASLGVILLGQTLGFTQLVGFILALVSIVGSQLAPVRTLRPVGKTSGESSFKTAS